MAAIGAASLLVNQPMSLLGDRRRPDREDHDVPEARWVPMPTSTSFPSNSASAAAFAVAVSDVVPALRVPLGAVAGTVAFSRVYVGVHYPGDVLVRRGHGSPARTARLHLGGGSPAADPRPQGSAPGPGVCLVEQLGHGIRLGVRGRSRRS